MNKSSSKSVNIIEIKDFSLCFPSKTEGMKPVLNKLNLSIKRGSIFGVIGNSGCGKTMTAMSIASLLPKEASIQGGDILFNGQSLLSMDPHSRRLLLGDKIGVIFQEPMSALDPLMRIEAALGEVLISHGVKDKNEIRSKIMEMLKVVGFKNPDAILNRYPHQLSGGQRQRILIAGAALLKPSLLICDEPTSALDTVTTISILELLRSMSISMGITMLFISHDLNVVGCFCDYVAVMKDGAIIEKGITSRVLRSPQTPYTLSLLRKSRLDNVLSNDFFLKPNYSETPLLEVSNMSSGYDGRLFSRQKHANVIHDISFKMYPKEVLGVIGGSGCGKTTLAKTICGLLTPTAGTMLLNDVIIGVVFQDPASCLNPSHNILWHLLEPLKAKKIKLSKLETRELLIATMKEVNLKPSYLLRYPHQLSGGQRQRVAIAMCLILKPKLIIADEPFSSLDASSAANVLSLLSSIYHKYNTAILLISHNLHIVSKVASRVMVMDSGTIVESGQLSEVFASPSSQAAKDLLEAERKLNSNPNALS